jgi:eukaryotic-like serine/threonine-protein kinase
MSSESPPGHPAGTTPPVLNDRYEIGERLAEGTFFYTHRGRDVESGRTVAIKVLKPEYAGDEVFTGNLLTEALSASTLQHPNIAQVIDAWRERGTVVIITEWVRGINLKDRIRRVAPFPLAVAVDILQACAEALGHAHENGYIHGDVRPDNVIITPDGRVKVTDFGVGASVAASTRIQLNALPQAAYYLAPELAEGRAPDARTDLYSLGCILYEMLAGKLPFEAETPLAVAVKHLHEPVPSLRDANPAVPNAVDGIAQKLMQKNPMARYLSARNLLGDIRAVQEAMRGERPLTWSPVRAAPAAGEMESLPVAERSKVRPARPVPEPDGGPSAMLLGGVALVGVLMILIFYLGVMLVTRPPAQVGVPDVLKKTQAEAVAALKQVRLNAEVREDYNGKVPAGIVYDSVPKPGMEMRANKTVVLYVSRGLQPVTVPDVVGKPLSQARNEVKAAGLALGETREENSEVVAKGEVLSQTPTGGSEAKKSTPVYLVVSKGPEPIEEPADANATPGNGDPDSNPDSGAGNATGDPVTPNLDLPARDHEVSFQLSPNTTGPQHVKIVVRHEDGTEETALEQDFQAGDEVNYTVTTRGRKGTGQIRVYLNGRLINSRDV